MAEPVMKHFTRAWACGNLKPKQVEKAKVSYRAHILQIAAQLPEGLADLPEISLHDGLFRETVWDPGRKSLLMQLRCGDNQGGYFDLSLQYADVAIEGAQMAEVGEWISDARTEILYDEVDVAGPGTFVHRLLLAPDGEFAIVFGGFRLFQWPAEGRSFEAPGERFRVAR